MYTAAKVMKNFQMTDGFCKKSANRPEKTHNEAYFTKTRNGNPFTPEVPRSPPNSRRTPCEIKIRPAFYHHTSCLQYQ